MIEISMFRRQIMNTTDSKKSTNAAALLKYSYAMISPECFQYRASKETDKEYVLFGKPLTDAYFVGHELDDKMKEKNIAMLSQLLSGVKFVYLSFKHANSTIQNIERNNCQRTKRDCRIDRRENEDTEGSVEESFGQILPSIDIGG